MAGIDTRQTRILGFARLADLDAARHALCAVPGPTPRFHDGPFIGVVLQDEPDRPLTARDRLSMIADLETMQRRLEIACLAGPFLPMDPSAACCPSDAVAALLKPNWERLHQALLSGGSGHQWDISLAWQPEAAVAGHRPVIAPEASHGPDEGTATRDAHERRKAELLASLRPVLLAMTDGSVDTGDTRVRLTVLVEAARESELEDRLALCGDDVAIEMRGPMPPVSFFAVRLVNLDAVKMTNAWTILGLPERADMTDLHRQWRMRAAAAHPDRGVLATLGASVADLTAAHRVLRDLMSEAPGDRHTLDGLLRLSGRRLVLPSPVAPVFEAALAS